MAEVKNLGDDNHCLIATQDYKEGDVILVELTPLIRLAPGSKDDEAAHFAECDVATNETSLEAKTAQATDDDHSSSYLSFYECITVPDDVDRRFVGKFRGMVQAAVSFASQTPTEGAAELLLSLYHPSLTVPPPHEVESLKLARQALSYLEVNAKGPKLMRLLQRGDDDNTLLKVMLIWSCNSFEGGRIYSRMSRINHSCDPNAIIRTSAADGESQSVVAAASIKAGEEITISYLGTFVYASRSTRRDILLQEKHFLCRCQRCSGACDLAMRIPCTFCHSRQKQLDEDVQYDDDRTVKYMLLANDSVFTCEECKKPLDGGTGDGEKMVKTIRSIEAKVVTIIREDATRSHGSDPDQEDKLLNEESRRQLLELASSFLGARHWTTNILLLLELAHLLEQFHADLISSPNEAPTGQEMETLAEGIDMLERIVRFVDGLELKLHRGHLLSDAIIGMARALVSLGDVKSQKYAAEWLAKLDGYVDMFEEEGLQKVAQALKVAWLHGDADEAASKKRKLAD